MKRKGIVFFLILIFVVSLGTESNVSLGQSSQSNTSEYAITFKEPITIRQRIAKFINDQKVKTHTIQVEYVDKKGKKINPDRVIHLKDGTKYNLLNMH